MSFSLQHVTHSELAEGVENAVKNEKYVGSLDTNKLSLSHTPQIEYGDTIVCSLGVRYNSYCSDISRTFLVNPNDEIRSYYNFLLKLEDFLLEKLMPGAKFSEVYEAGVDYVRHEKTELVNNLPASFGFATGIVLQERSICIGPQCKAIVKKDMVFILHLALKNLNNHAIDGNSKTYTLMLGDTGPYE